MKILTLSVFLFSALSPCLRGDEASVPPVIPNDEVVKIDIGGGESREFESLEDAERWMLQEKVNRLRDRGVSDEMIFVVEESWSRNQQDEISGFADWLARYDGEMFDPPVVFDLTDAHEPDFSTPLQSLRSYWTAMHLGDAKTLLSNSDESALKRLRGHYGVNENQRKDSYLYSPYSKFTVFFSGRTRIGGNEYVLLFSRREAAENPKQNNVSFHRTFFKRSGNGFVLSEAPRGSHFADVLYVMGADRMHVSGPYPQFYERLKHSEIPERFYTIE